MWWSQKEKKKFGGQNWRVFFIIKRLSDKRNYVHWFPLHSCSTAHNVRDFNIFFCFIFDDVEILFLSFLFCFCFLKLEIFVVGYSEKKKKNPLTANMSEDNIVFLGPFLKYSSDCIMFWVMQHRFVKKKKKPHEVKNII